jgi:hypothetical protein
MNWNVSASKHYQGPIDRVFVSMHEVHSIEVFIDEYLRTRRVPLTDDSRRMVGEKLETFLGRVPYLWGDLAAFLDCDGHAWLEPNARRAAT